MREIWKPVVGFEEEYSVSNLGNVKHNNTNRKSGRGNYERKEHLLKQRKNNKGYYIVDIYKADKRYQFLVHRLVAMAFLPNVKGYAYVNHIDENKENNSLDNLEWCTQKYNMNYGTCPQKIGLSNSKPVIQLDKNNNFVNEYISIIEAQRKTGISNGSIGDCLHKRRKTAGGFKWKYKK